MTTKASSIEAPVLTGTDLASCEQYLAAYHDALQQASTANTDASIYSIMINLAGNLLTHREQDVLLANHRDAVDSGDEQAAKTFRDVLVYKNVRLVAAVAAKVVATNHDMPVDDIFAAGLAGLTRAVELYSRKAALSTYATVAIRRHIEREATRHTPGGVAPYASAAHLSLLRVHQATLSRSDMDAIAGGSAGYQAARIFWGTFGGVKSLDAPLDDEPDSADVVDTVADTADGYHDVDSRIMLQYLILHADLTEHERRIVSLFLDGHTQTEIGKIMGIRPRAVMSSLKYITGKIRAFAARAGLADALKQEYA